MIYDCNPDVTFLFYGTPRKWDLLNKEVNKRKLKLREIKLFQLEIPLDKRYDLTMNWLKEFVMFDYWKARSPLNSMPSIVRKMLMNKLGAVETFKFEKRWENHAVHNLLLANICPLFIEQPINRCTTKQELKNLEKLKTFDSVGYKCPKQMYKEKDFRYDLNPNFTKCSVD